MHRHTESQNLMHSFEIPYGSEQRGKVHSLDWILVQDATVVHIFASSPCFFPRPHRNLKFMWMVAICPAVLLPDMLVLSQALLPCRAMVV